jgi:methylenetetrahydrofolate dehydrogenase (NADP+)/methenyltetrahydrofolate cyclohydrolase
MIPLLLDGRRAQEQICARLYKAFAAQPATLAIVQVGNNTASTAYIKQKIRFGERVGARVVYKKFPADISESDLLFEIDALNRDESVSGIIVQLPLPAHIGKQQIQNAVALAKDVDGLASGSPFMPATARGVLELLAFFGIAVVGKAAVVFGRSAVAGGAIARARARAGPRVSVVHSQTPSEEAKAVSRASDIIVAAIGKPKLLGSAYFRSDRKQVVVDVGITRGELALVGDVDFEKVAPIVAAISPVPGGVGPMTVAALFENLHDAVKSA